MEPPGAWRVGGAFSLQEETQTQRGEFAQGHTASLGQTQAWFPGLLIPHLFNILSSTPHDLSNNHGR